MTAVALRDRDDEAQVRVDHALLGGEVATLDALRERDFLGGGEQVVTADLGEEAAERVGRDAGRVDRKVEHQLVVVVLAVDFHAVLGEDHADVLDRLLVEAVLERERLELGRPRCRPRSSASATSSSSAAMSCVVSSGISLVSGVQ